MTEPDDDYDPNSCPHCGRQDCVYLRGADCPVMEERWAQWREEADARANPIPESPLMAFNKSLVEDAQNRANNLQIDGSVDADDIPF